MKRLFLILSLMIMASSCFDDNMSQMKYTLIANFDNGGYDFKSDSTFVNNLGVGFNHDLLGFYHQMDTDNIWFDGGFMLSRFDTPKSGSTAGLRNTYRAYLTKGSTMNGNVYAVYHQNPDEGLMPKHDIKFLAIEDGSCQMLGCYVTNTVEVADAIRQNFKEGDKLTLKATGYLFGNKTGETQINLAEFTAQKDSIVSKWTAFDLDKLGSVEYVDLELISTNANIPGYVCIDSVVANVFVSY